MTSNPLSPRALFGLTLFSTFVFVFSALLMQFVLTLHTAILLKINSISFQYSLFAINFISESSYSIYHLNDQAHNSTIWSEEQIYIIFGSGPIILTALGIRLLFTVKKHLNASWKTRLALTWLAFLMVNALPCSIIAGVMFYDGFGTAFQWIVTNYFIRALIGLGVVLFLLIFSHFWQRQFLNTSFNPAFTDDEYHQRTFIRNVYFKPWIYGLVILMLFSWPFSNLLWPACIVCLGILPSFNQTLRYQAIVVMNPEERVFTSRKQVIMIIAVLAMILVAGNFRINL